jgi:Xaa-Pro aminopeptidase
MILFERGEYLARVGRTKAAMAKRGLDTLLVASPANQFYLTGYDGWSFYTPQMAVVSQAQDGVMIAVAIALHGRWAAVPMTHTLYSVHGHWTGRVAVMVEVLVCGVSARRNTGKPSRDPANNFGENPDK